MCDEYEVVRKYIKRYKKNACGTNFTTLVITNTNKRTVFIMKKTEFVTWITKIRNDLHTKHVAQSTLGPTVRILVV